MSNWEIVFYLRMVWRRNICVTCGKCRVKGGDDKCLAIKEKNDDDKCHMEKGARWQRNSKIIIKYELVANLYKVKNPTPKCSFFSPFPSSCTSSSSSPLLHFFCYPKPPLMKFLSFWVKIKARLKEFCLTRSLFGD